jgi:hypothetical protein
MWSIDNYFDRIILNSRSGFSSIADNIQLLCARYNIEKRDNIKKGRAINNSRFYFLKNINAPHKP